MTLKSKVYLEDRQFYVFDEWAADQDPDFKKFFYNVILPDLKKRGKTVLAITHDEQYFHIADRHIKMESGKVILNDVIHKTKCENLEMIDNFMKEN